MKTRIRILSIISSTIMVMTLASLSVQALSARVLVAKVPFNFYVKDKALPAGEYRIEAIQVGGSPALKIQSSDGWVTAIVAIRLVSAESHHLESRLVFNRFGDQYFLSQIQGFEENSIHTLTRSRVEDALAKRGSTPKHYKVPITGHHQ